MYRCYSAPANYRVVHLVILHNFTSGKNVLQWKRKSVKQCQCQTADRFKQTINSSVNFCLGTSIEKLITLMYSKVPREDCQKVPENVCKPETRVKVVEVEEEVCEELVTTPRTTTTTTTRAPVTKAVVEPGRSYILFPAL